MDTQERLQALDAVNWLKSHYTSRDLPGGLFAVEQTDLRVTSKTAMTRNDLTSGVSLRFNVDGFVSVDFLWVILLDNLWTPHPRVLHEIMLPVDSLGQWRLQPLYYNRGLMAQMRSESKQTRDKSWDEAKDWTKSYPIPRGNVHAVLKHYLEAHGTTLTALDQWSPRRETLQFGEPEMYKFQSVSQYLLDQEAKERKVAYTYKMKH